jgi:hypothetical protein
MTKEESLLVATRLGDMCIHLSSVVLMVVEDMLKFCNEHNIKIDYNEKRQWDMLAKCTRNLDAMILDESKEKRIIFRRNVKMFAILMRLILARVDDDDMKLYKWYNYIKSFPADLPEIQPTGEEEIEAFKHLFG